MTTKVASLFGLKIRLSILETDDVILQTQREKN
jgi:hypothetical protein